MALDPTGYRQVIISQNDCLFKPVSVHDVRNAEWETLLGISKTLINGLDGDRVQTRRSGVGQRDHPGHTVDIDRARIHTCQSPVVVGIGTVRIVYNSKVDN